MSQVRRSRDFSHGQNHGKREHESDEFCTQIFILIGRHQESRLLQITHGKLRVVTFFWGVCLVNLTNAIWFESFIKSKPISGLRVFCVGNSCFLRRWLVFVFFATVAVGGVFCNGGGCFLRRSWWEGMFFATAGHVFCIGRVCFLRRWCFLRR